MFKDKDFVLADLRGGDRRAERVGKRHRNNTRKGREAFEKREAVKLTS